jgi:hypothetical protein
MLETPKALDTKIFKKQKTKFLFVFLLVKILMDVTMDNQQETKNFIQILI